MRKQLLYLSILSLVALTAGCGTAQREETSPSPENNQQLQLQQSMPENANGHQKGSRTEYLEALAMSVPGVESAHCVLLGNTAIVGVNVSAGEERSRVGMIKYSVAEALRKDPEGAGALVTADIDLTARLREMGADVRAGRPVAGFTEELADIIGRIIPQLPMDVMPAEDVENAPDAEQTPSANVRETPSSSEPR